MTPTIEMERATGTDLGRVARLCQRAGLPADDIHDATAAFYLAEADGLVAVGGIEDCGSVGLLRSITVPEDKRGQGYGVAMVDALVERARGEYDALYLLTTTAESFFRERGFESVEREAVPDSIRETTQFADLCPTTATVMRRSLR